MIPGGSGSNLGNPSTNIPPTFDLAALEQGIAGLVSSGSGGLQQAFSPLGYENPKPDKRLNSIINTGPYTGLPTLQQGFMVQDQSWVKAVGSSSSDPATAMAAQPSPYKLNFMFNPSDIGVSYGIDNTMTMPSQLTPDQLAAQSIVPGQTAISWNLLFDRTYECWDGGQNNGGVNFKNSGVYTDIAFFEYMTGIRVSSATGVITQNMLPVPLVVLFGGGTGPDYSTLSEVVLPGEQAAYGSNHITPNVGLAFVGYIQSCVVDYSHFTSKMVPVRASMSITMQQLIGATVSAGLNGGQTFGTASTTGYNFGNAGTQLYESGTTAPATSSPAKAGS